ncbi:oxidoreductase [Gloeophyllum trabeum ATCC 11539]|uniref:3-dehydrosphinganine reductase n=1 Tax=Gloeophyllum trabeum (strain ATCC 11539 / FP-39264 / Madison 617) TaxID=670483 RepID=S7RRK4_GLOTA|nr:oxidoreductase [Gloeophyllum trabeum ATCC 11539]EPQ55594.1 oxidoreductase [Gloeophyllum trabeum ATCC 11539]
MGLFGGSKWNPAGKHCYVTGGSAGLGLSLAVLLASHGAHVSIVARDSRKLQDALGKVESARVSNDQVFRQHSFSVGTAEGASAALQAVMDVHDGLTPDAVFLCAGKSTPKFFVEMTEQDLTEGMTNGYWVQAWTAWAVTKKMVEQQRKGKICFVSSTLGYMSFIGYASYSPPKHALRGLADTLRSELILYDIDVHIFFPPTMFTPGYEEENKTKPKITLKIEEDDSGLQPNQAAAGLLKGIQAGHAHITADLITDLFRSSTRGSAPYHNFIYDSLLDAAARIGLPFWRSQTDGLIRKHKAEHQQYLKQQGFPLR